MQLITSYTALQIPKGMSYSDWVLYMFKDAQRVLQYSPNESHLLDYGYLYCIMHKTRGPMFTNLYWRIWHMKSISTDYRSVAVIESNSEVLMERIKWYRLNRYKQTLIYNGLYKKHIISKPD